MCFKDKVKNWPSSFVLQIIQNTAKYIKSFPPNRSAVQNRVYLFSFKLMIVSTNHRILYLKHS